jgi:DNA-binding CsgD family transcriptional regulator
MSLHRLVEEYTSLAPRSRNGVELLNLTEAVSREIGFPRLAIVQVLWFRCPDQRLIRLDNFDDYGEIFVRRKFFLDDPALLACQRIGKGFLWSDTRRLLPRFTRRQEMIFLEAHRHGMREGFAFPVGVIGEPHGCCSFATDGELPSIWHRRAISLIAADAFHEARRLHGFPRRTPRLPRISRRKLECLRLLACGKQDKEIAAILGIALSTVRSYMTWLRQTFDASGRAQLAADALRYGLIGYDDIIPS